MPDSDAEDAPAAAPAAAPSIYTCASLADLHAALSHLTAREAATTQRLAALLSTHAELAHSLTRLDLLRAHLGTQVVAARTLTNTLLSPAASTASRISSAVRRLDTEQSRVQATLAVVSQVADLKSCVQGITDSMGASQDWETAANHLHRASKIPHEIITGGFAEEMVPSAEIPDLPSVTLHNAAESLCGLFLREFEKAAAAADGEKVTRFFKLFPLIGRTEVGLDVYGRYVCQGVAARAREGMRGRGEGLGDFWYANALSRLFEHIASIVEQHGGLVEKHYGEGRMIRVIERLQVEADTQGGIIVDTWGDERNIDRKLTEIKTYAFSFLVQSFLPRAHPLPAPTPEDDPISIQEIDLHLSELSIMLSRWSLYTRFISHKHNPNPPLRLSSVLTSSTLSQKITDRLQAPYAAMSTFFIRRSVEKAFQIDEPPDLASHPPISSAVDDVMYVIKTHLQRTLSTSLAQLTISVVATVGRVLGSDFIGVIQRKMQTEAYPRSTGEDKAVAFLVLLNNLDVAVEYFARIVGGFEELGGGALGEQFPFEGEEGEVRGSLRGAEAAFRGKAGELVADGVGVFFNQVVKARLRPLLTEAWGGVEYVGEEAGREEDGEEEGGEGVKGRFAEGWEGLMTPYKKVLTEKVFGRLLGTTAGYLARLLEKRIWGYAGRVSELGAIRLERDVAGVVGVVVRGGMYGVRDAFARCVQICLVVNMEEDEVGDMLGGDGGVEWKLEVDERRRARGMIVGGRHGG